MEQAQSSSFVVSKSALHCTSKSLELRGYPSRSSFTELERRVREVFSLLFLHHAVEGRSPCARSSQLCARLATTTRPLAAPRQKVPFHCGQGSELRTRSWLDDPATSVRPAFDGSHYTNLCQKIVLHASLYSFDTMLR